MRRQADRELSTKDEAWPAGIMFVAQTMLILAINHKTEVRNGPTVLA